MRFLSFALASTILISLVGCGQRSPQQTAQAGQNQPATMATGAKPSASKQLLAAAEPFEKLTEIAFAAPLPEIDATIAEARKAAESVRPDLTFAARSRLDKSFTDIGRARNGQDRAGLALASIEIYRGIVSSVPPGTKVPASVSLLDYAGFRYQADLKAVPVRWVDMNDAMRFARTQWADLRPTLKDASLAASFEKTLAVMEKAAASKDARTAASSATQELNLVDKLEAYFTGQPASAL